MMMMMIIIINIIIIIIIIMIKLMERSAMDPLKKMKLLPTHHPS